MRITPRNVGLALALAGLIATQIALDGTGGEERVIGRLFPAISSASARRILITDPEGIAPDDRLLLARDAEGVWTLPDHLDYPAREGAVQTLFTGLTSLTNLDLLADEPQSHGRYGVGQRGLEILVLGEGDARLAGLVQGTGADAAGRSSYVRPMGSDEVYRAPYLPRQRLAAAVWIDTRFLDFPLVAVQAITVSGAELDSVFRLVRDGVDRWRIEDGEDVPSSIVRELLERATALFFDEVVARGTAAEFPTSALELALELTDETEVRAVFAGPDADGTHQAHRDGSEWVVRFGADAYDLILEAALALAPEDR